MDTITQMGYHSVAAAIEINVLSLNVLAQAAHQYSREAGFYTNPRTLEPITDRNPGEMIALMHSELSEMLEGVRKSKMDDHIPLRSAEEVEAADLIIRLLDYAAYRKLDLAGAVRDKMAYNRTRADHKLENRAKPGGKSF